MQTVSDNQPDDAGSATGGSFAVKLEFFSGPMDLLLHLVAQQEVSIDQVQMSAIAEQYLDIVCRNTASLDLDVATEYLVIATTLLAIKSKSLLPSETINEDDLLPDGDEDNRFFETLRERLKAYQLAKDRAKALIETPQLGVDFFCRIDRAALKPTPEMLAEPEDALDLGQLYQGLLKRIGASSRMYHVTKDPVSVVSYMMRLIDILGVGKKDKSGDTAGNSRQEDPKRGIFQRVVAGILPDALLNAIRGKAPRTENHNEQMRNAVLGGFIAVLELAKRGLMKVETEAESGNFSLSLAIDPQEGLAFVEGEVNSEFDTEMTEAQESETNDNVIDIDSYRRSQAQDTADTVEDTVKNTIENDNEELKEVGSV